MALSPEQQLRQNTILAQFGELALQSDNLDQILTEACRLVGEALGTDFAKVVQLQNDGKTLMVRAGVGWKEGVIGVATIDAADDTSEGFALKTGEPMVSPDIDKETRFRYADFLIDNGARAVANVIIIGGSNRPPFGLLQIDSRIPREFTDEDLAFLRGYANLLAATVDRLRVLDEMRDTSARLRLALEAGELGSFELNISDGEITGSERFDKIVGKADSLPVRTRATLIDRVAPEDRGKVEEALSGLAADGAELRVECRLNSDPRWVELRGRSGADGGDTRLVGIVADITERKRAEKALEATNEMLEAQVSERTISLAESNAQLDAFAYTVSHDLRAPLRAMEGFARILLDDHGADLGTQGERYATRIVGAAKRMEVLIDDLLAFSRVQRSDVVMQAIDPAKVIRRAVSALMEDGLNPHLSVTVDDTFPLIEADRTVLTQVLVNLITNAAKFQKNSSAAQIVVRADQRHDRVRIWVEDNGIGIAPEHQGRIFKVFERLHGQETYPGTGVGLAIVKAGVERMGGTYGVESALGHGSKFWIELRAAGIRSPETAA